MSRSRAKASTRIKNSKELIEKFQKDCIIRGMTSESTVRYVSTLKIFDAFLREKHIDLLQVEGNVLRDWQ